MVGVSGISRSARELAALGEPELRVAGSPTSVFCYCRRRTMTHAPAERVPTTSAPATAMPMMVGRVSSSDDESDMSDSTVIVGTSSTVMPSASEAASAVPRLEESEVRSASAVVEAGTAIVAVMRTLAAVTRILTSDLSTPATFLRFPCSR